MVDWHRQEEAKHEKNTGRVKVVRKELVLVEAAHKELDPEEALHEKNTGRVEVVRKELDPEEVALAKQLKKTGQPARRLGRQLDLHAPAPVTLKQRIVQPTA